MGILDGPMRAVAKTLIGVLGAEVHTAGKR
jgi:hypothetical protein